MPKLQGLEPLQPQDRAVDALRAVAHFIAVRGLKTGDRLPTERQLMARLAVGRSTVREVIRKLQGQGVVESRRGAGTFLLRPTSADAIHIPVLINATDLRDRLLQTLDVRRGLEAEACALAAERATQADIAEIEIRLTEMERVHRETGNAGSQDLAFHLAVYEAAHNPLFGQLLAQFREAFEGFWKRPFDRSDFALRSVPLHRKLFEAITRRDAKKARKHALAILAIVEEDIKEMSR